MIILGNMKNKYILICFKKRCILLRKLSARLAIYLDQCKKRRECTYKLRDYCDY